MPFLDDAEPAGLAPQGAWQSHITTPAAPFGDLMRAAVARDNSLGSLVQSVTQQPRSPADQSFDPWTNIAGYEDYASSFSGANSAEDVIRIKGRIDKERRRADLLQSGGVMGMLAETIAGIADPINLIPVGGEALMIGRAGLRALSGAARIGAAGAVSGIAQESVLQATQETRDLGESAVNVAAQTVLGGLLGGAIGTVVGRDLAPLARGMMGETEQVAADMAGNIPSRGGAGAMPVEGSEPWAWEQYSENYVPEGWYVHGRAQRQDLDTGNVLQLTQNWDIADQYAGTEGSRWLIRPKQDAVVFDLSSDATSDMNRVVAAAREDFHAGRLPDDLIDWLEINRHEGESAEQALERGIRADFAPARLVDSAGAFDSPELMQWFYERFQADFVKTADGAVALNRDMIETAKVPNTEPTSRAPVGPGYDGGSVGAAAASRTMASEDIARLGRLPQAMAWSAPTLRTQTSPVLSTRLLAQELAEQPLMTKGNLEGIPSPIAAESQIRQFQYPLAKGLIEADDAFVRYRLGREPKFGDQARIGLWDLGARVVGATEKMTRDQFMEAVGRAMRRDDQSEIPEVAAAAKSMRKNVFDPLKDRATELGLLPEDVETGTAASYLMRQYNYGKIAAERNQFTDIVTNWYAEQQQIKAGVQRRVQTLTDELAEHEALVQKLTAQMQGHAERAERTAIRQEEIRRVREFAYNIARAQSRADAARTELESALLEWEGKSTAGLAGSIQRRNAKEGARQFGATIGAEAPKEGRLTEADDIVMSAAKRILAADTRLERQELADIARQTVDRILGTPAGRLSYDIRTPQPGFMLPNETPDLRAKALKGRVFMIPDHLIEDYLESDATQIARAYVRTMAPDVTLAERGWLDFDEKIKPIMEQYQVLRAATNDPAELTKLNNRMNADIRDVKAIYERLRGTYALPEDPNSIVTRGFRIVRDLNYLRLLGGMTLSALPDIGRVVMQHGFVRVFNDGFRPMAMAWTKYRLAAAEVKMAGEALDMVLDTRAMSLADVMDDFGQHSKFERGIASATGQFGMVSLMAPWNATLKQLVGVISQTRSLQAIEALGVGTIDAGERTRLAQFGIGEDEARAIGAQFAKYGEKHGSLWWANTDAWTDRRAAEAYRAALSKEINQVIVTPGQEKPLWLSTEMGKVLGQFRSFSMASMQRVTLAALQQRDAAVLNGTALMVGLGAMTYYLKSDHDHLSDDPAVWVKEGIDRSGLTGWMFDANNIIEKMTRGAIGASRLVGGPMASRYASRGVLESILGPTAGIVNDLAQVTGSAASADWRASDSHAMRRMVPLQNLLGFKMAVDRAEEGLNAAFGVQ